MDFIYSYYYNKLQSKKHFRQFFFFITPSYFNICGMLRKGIPLLFYNKLKGCWGQKSPTMMPADCSVRRSFLHFLIYGNIFQLFLQFFS